VLSSSASRSTTLSSSMAAPSVGSAHSGADQLQGMEYMAKQAESTIETSGLRLGERPLHWYCLNDIVMGGRSSSTASSLDGALVFSGEINTQGGGFAGCRTSDLTEAQRPAPTTRGLWLTVSGEHTHRVKVTLGAGSEADPTDDSGETLGIAELDMRGDKGRGKGKNMAQRWAGMSVAERQGLLSRLSWSCDISEHLSERGSPLEPRRVFVPLSTFSASLFGQSLPKLRCPDMSSLTHLGLNAGVFDASSKARLDMYGDGPFKVVLHGVEFGDGSAL